MQRLYPKFCIFVCYLFGLNTINKTIPESYLLALRGIILNIICGDGKRTG